LKNPLTYQRTEYDCGLTTLLNAISFLFDREEIPPEVLKFISIYSTDSYNLQGEHGKGGTSRMAMMFISGWLNEYGKAAKFPVETDYLSGGTLSAQPGSRITQALLENGVVIVRVMYEVEHYILLTGLDGFDVLAWDPWYRDTPFTGRTADIRLIHDAPFCANCKFPLGRLNEKGRGTYHMSDPETREAILLFNKTTRKKQAYEPEYHI
jgi:hypothetical protein